MSEPLSLVCIRDLRRLPLSQDDYDVHTATWWTLHLSALDRVDMAVLQLRSAELPADVRGWLFDQAGVSSGAWSEVMGENDETGAVHLDLHYPAPTGGDIGLRHDLLIAVCQVIVGTLLPNRTISWDVSAAGDWEQLVPA